MDGLKADRDLDVPSMLQEKFGKEIKHAEITPLAQRLRKWLSDDLVCIQKKHLTDTYGETLVLLATFMDPRFTHDIMFTAIVQSTVEAEMVKLAVRRSEAYPDALAEMMVEKETAVEDVSAADIVAELEKAGRGRTWSGSRQGEGEGFFFPR